MNNLSERLKQAKQDVSDAWSLYEKGSPSYGNALYLLQQGYEKATKYYLKKKGMKFHDMDDATLGHYFDPVTNHCNELFLNGSAHLVKHIVIKDSNIKSKTTSESTSRKNYIKNNPNSALTKLISPNSLGSKDNVISELYFNYPMPRAEFDIREFCKKSLSTINPNHVLGAIIRAIVLLYNTIEALLSVEMNANGECRVVMSEPICAEQYEYMVDPKGSDPEQLKTRIKNAEIAYNLFIITRYLAPLNSISRYPYDHSQKYEWETCWPILLFSDLCDIIETLPK